MYQRPYVKASFLSQTSGIRTECACVKIVWFHMVHVVFGDLTGGSSLLGDMLPSFPKDSSMGWDEDESMRMIRCGRIKDSRGAPCSVGLLTHLGYTSNVENILKYLKDSNQVRSAFEVECV